MDVMICDDRARSEYDACDNQDIHLLLPPFQQAHLKRLYFCHCPGRIQHTHNHSDERDAEHQPLQELCPKGPADSRQIHGRVCDECRDTENIVDTHDLCRTLLFGIAVFRHLQ